MVVLVKGFKIMNHLPNPMPISKPLIIIAKYVISIFLNVTLVEHKDILTNLKYKHESYFKHYPLS